MGVFKGGGAPFRAYKREGVGSGRERDSDGGGGREREGVRGERGGGETRSCEVCDGCVEDVLEDESVSYIYCMKCGMRERLDYDPCIAGVL